MTDCVFCRIVTGDAPSEIVAQNERALAVMDINPATNGHTLVISKTHAADIWELERVDGDAVWSLTSDVAVGIRDSLHPDGLTLVPGDPEGRLARRLPFPPPPGSEMVGRRSR